MYILKILVERKLMKWHFYVKNPSKNQGKILLF